MQEQSPTPNDSPNASQATVDETLHAHALAVAARLAELVQQIREAENAQQACDFKSLPWTVHQLTIISLNDEYGELKIEERRLAKQLKETLRMAEMDGEIKRLATRYSDPVLVGKKIEILRRKLSNLPRQITDGLTKGCTATQKRYAPLIADLATLVAAMESGEEQAQHVAAAVIVQHHDERLYAKISQIDAVRNQLIAEFIDTFKTIIPDLKTAGIWDKNHGGGHD